MARSRPRLIRSNQTPESCRWLAMSVLYPEGKEHPGPEKQTSSRKWLQGRRPGLWGNTTRGNRYSAGNQILKEEAVSRNAQLSRHSPPSWGGRETPIMFPPSLCPCVILEKKIWKTTKLLLAWSPDGFHFWKGQRALSLNQDKEGHTMHFWRCRINYQSKPLLPGN